MNLYKGIRVEYNANLLYIISFVCYLINTFLNHTMFTQLNSYPMIKVILFAVTIICLLIKFLFVDFWTSSKLFIYTSLILLMCTISFQTGDRQLITLLALILGANNVNFRYVLLVFISINIIMLIVTYLFSAIDVIPNLQYSRIREGDIKIRNSFGTGYPTVFAAYLQSIVVAYAYLMNTRKFINHILLFLLSIVACYLSLEYADARMSGYSIILFLCLYYTCFIFFRNIYKHPLFILIISATYVIGFITIFYLSYYFDQNNELFSTLNTVLSGRLGLAYQAFKDYNIPILGQEVKFIGLGGAVQEMSDDYNYVDSSYLQFLIKYGLVFTCCSIFAFTVLTFKRLKLNDYKFISVIFIISFSSMVEDRLLDISINVYWVLLYSYYSNFIGLAKK